MTLPPALRAAVEAHAGPVSAAAPVSGGSINDAYRLATASGPAFLKTNRRAPAGFFAAEARGLDALRRAAAADLRIPHVLALSDPHLPSEVGDARDADGPAWLLLEWLEPGPRGSAFDERLGRAVAALHRADAGDAWGGDVDNVIGALPQENGRAETWAAFWRDRRLLPQLRMAEASGRLPGRISEWDALFARLPDVFAPVAADRPSRLHGDLWSGNVLSAGGSPALVDPATYAGHREADLAMAELFGGFGARFHAAYAEAAPLAPGYAEVRRPVLQLYYLLVHVNLFGGGYVAQTAATLRTTLTAKT